METKCSCMLSESSSDLFISHQVRFFSDYSECFKYLCVIERFLRSHHLFTEQGKQSADLYKDLLLIS